MNIIEYLVFIKATAETRQGEGRNGGGGGGGESRMWMRWRRGLRNGGWGNEEQKVASKRGLKDGIAYCK